MTVTTFSELELDESLLEALQDKGFTRPTAIQAPPFRLRSMAVMYSVRADRHRFGYLLPALQHLLDFRVRNPVRHAFLIPPQLASWRCGVRSTRELAKHTHLDIATIRRRSLYEPRKCSAKISYVYYRRLLHIKEEN